jgi:opacity protein-like surface antigen
MRHRIVMLTVAVVAFLAAGAAAAAGSAQAATPLTTSIWLHQANQDMNCIGTNGVGNPLTDNAYYNGCANITITGHGTEGGDPAYQFTDGNGRCIGANSSDVVVVESGGCTDTSDEIWIDTYGTVGNGNTVRFENAARQLWMMCTGTVAGDKVRVGTGGANDWDLLPNPS